MINFNKLAGCANIYRFDLAESLLMTLFKTKEKDFKMTLIAKGCDTDGYIKRALKSCTESTSSKVLPENVHVNVVIDDLMHDYANAMVVSIAVSHKSFNLPIVVKMTGDSAFAYYLNDSTNGYFVENANIDDFHVEMEELIIKL